MAIQQTQSTAGLQPPRPPKQAPAPEPASAEAGPSEQAGEYVDRAVGAARDMGAAAKELFNEALPWVLENATCIGTIPGLNTTGSGGTRSSRVG